MSDAGGANLEIAHRLNEKHDHTRKHGSLAEDMIEILEAIVLAIVAIATAYSGYQASLWDGRQGELYGEAARMNTSGAVLGIQGGQERLYDTVTFNSWLNCKSRGEKKLAQFIERRFRAEYRVAFNEWMKLNPINNAAAPPSPAMMSIYRNANGEQSAVLTQKASEVFETGTRARYTGDRYVRVTVFLATVLLLTAISQRFRIKSIRTGLVVFSFVLLVVGLWSLLKLPRI
jgi:hypothetical protein